MEQFRSIATQYARIHTEKMYRAPQPGPKWLAVGARLERGVRRHRGTRVATYRHKLHNPGRRSIGSLDIQDLGLIQVLYDIAYIERLACSGASALLCPSDRRGSDSRKLRDVLVSQQFHARWFRLCDEGTHTASEPAPRSELVASSDTTLYFFRGAGALRREPLRWNARGAFDRPPWPPSELKTEEPTVIQ